jgi:hypothetical protein
VTDATARNSQPVGWVEPLRNPSSLPERGGIGHNASAPIEWVDTAPGRAVKRRIPPVPHARHPSVLDRIEVDVVDMPFVVAFILQRVFPIAALPDAAFALAQAAQRNPFARGKSARERGLDQPPAGRVVGVVSGNDQMEWR